MSKCIWFPEAFSTLPTKPRQEAHSIRNVSVPLNNTPLTSTSLHSAAGSARTSHIPAPPPPSQICKCSKGFLFFIFCCKVWYRNHTLDGHVPAHTCTHLWNLTLASGSSTVHPSAKLARQTPKAAAPAAAQLLLQTKRNQSGHSAANNQALTFTNRDVRVLFVFYCVLV